MSNELYKKVNNKYVEVGVEFRGFPADGIWLVNKGSSSCMVQISEIPNLPQKSVIYRINNYEDLLEFLYQKVKDNDHKYALSDIAKWSCDYFAMLNTETILKEKQW